MMTAPEAIYSALPVPLQHAFVSLKGWKIKKRRYGTLFQTLLRQYEERNSWSALKLREYRDCRLQEFLRYCEKNVPYYRSKLQRLGISSRDIKSIEDIRELPVLNKTTVQRQYSKFVSESVPPRQGVIVHTSGTTGAGLRFAATKRALAEQWAVWWRYRHWHRIPLSAWCAYFGGRTIIPLKQQSEPFWRLNYPGHQIMFSGYHMSSENLHSYVSALKRYKLEWIHGYPSLISLIASYIVEYDVDLGYQPKWVTTGAENLLPHQRVLIRKAFGVEPRQHYGLAEGVANISECEYGKLHVDEDYAFVEFVPDEHSNGHKILGTNFSNQATALIRYDTGDIAQLEDSSIRCCCGRPGRLIKSIDGRCEDYIVLKNGAKLGRMDHIFKDMIHIREAQLRQFVRGEIEILIVPAEGYTESDEKKLLTEFRKRVGHYTKLSIHYVEELERSRSGKLRFVVSRLG